MIYTRTKEGGTNSAANFQKKVSECFSELRDNFKARVDDYISFAADEKKLMRILLPFFEVRSSRNLVVSLPKSECFLKQAVWCRRIIDSEGVRLNPKNHSGLKYADTPRTAAELCEYVHVLIRVSTSIPLFAERIGPLR